MSIFTHVWVSDMRHTGFLQVDGGQRDPREMGRHNRYYLNQLFNTKIS